MRKVYFNVLCKATYESSLEIPNDTKDEDVLNYIREHLNEANIESDLNHINDCEPEDAVELEDIKYVEEGTEENPNPTYSVEVFSKEDINLIDKLDNMRGSEISDRIFDLANEKGVFEKIEDEIWNLLGNKNLPYSDISYFKGLADEYEAKDEHDKWTAELYNCDLIYMEAIASVLGLTKPKDSGDILFVKEKDYVCR